ncbi:MAG: hypothetical protein M1418_10755, partial [Deltaproteobacteria bacterium]|nr:hypothetical protein [Deltaproteobacteria bacterium]
SGKRPPSGEVFDLEKAIVDQFIQAGRDRKEIVFLTTGVGAAYTTYGCINSHYFDPTKHVDGKKGFFRTKQAGRTGLGTVMIDKKIRAVVVLADFPHSENPYGADDWDRVKKAGARLGKVVREVDPQSLKMHRREQLRDLIQAYYRERGWTPSGIPTPVTLKRIGLWGFLTEEARTKIGTLAG